jgi:para-nitrobenzyl esterase
MEGAEHCGSKSARLIEDLDRVLAKLASSYWINFIKTGDPNGTSLPPWSSYRAAYRAGSVMKLDMPASWAPEEGRDRQTFLRDAAAALGS